MLRGWETLNYEIKEGEPFVLLGIMIARYRNGIRLWSGSARLGLGSARLGLCASLFFCVFLPIDPTGKGWPAEGLDDYREGTANARAVGEVGEAMASQEIAVRKRQDGTGRG